MARYVLIILFLFSISSRFAIADTGVLTSEDEDMYFSEYEDIDLEESLSIKDVKGKSLSDVIADKSEKKSRDDSSRRTTETWLDKLRNEALNEIKNPEVKPKEIKEPTKTSSLKSMIEDSKARTKDGKSNVAVFDVSGAMLRMSPKQIDDVLTRRGFRKITEKYEIPNFIKWRKEDECRAAGVVGFERLASCVVRLAKKEDYQYVEYVKYSKFDSKEDITINFTSNFTSNKSYKIIYSSMASAVRGNTQKAIYMRNIKIHDFWKRINHKYGAPDNKEDVIWGMDGNKPYMKAATGKLMLEDPMLKELDYTRMSREDQRFINTSLYNF